MKIYDVWQRDGLRPDRRSYPASENFGDVLVGVEVEVENAEGCQDGNYWTVKEDSSLRNAGRELVMTYPVAGIDVDLAMEELEKRCLVSTATAGPRTSVHVHMDVRNLELSDIAKLLVLFTAAESCIYSAGESKGRYSNIYSPGLTNNGQIATVKRVVKALIDEDGRALRHAVDRCLKYSGLNLLPMTNFGSIEFRMHRGTTDVEEIKNFLRMLVKLREVAVSYGSVNDIVEDLLNNQEHYASVVFNTNMYDSIYSNYYINNTCNVLYITDYITYSVTSQVNNTAISGLSPEQLAAIRHFREQLEGA